MKSKIKKTIAAMCCAAICIATVPCMTACGNGGKTLKDEYTVKYDLNYDGASSRTVSYQAGLLPVDWNATREGYELTGWFTDKACTSEYNFYKRIQSDVTLYASWKKQSDKVTVTFDGNCYGKEKDTAVQVDKGGKIKEKLAPDVDKVGFDFVGWYKDEAGTQKFDFENDTVNDDLRLYAKYVYDDSVEREKDGTPVYENTRINLWMAGDVVGDRIKYISEIVDRFNAEYAGKITVNATTSLLNQNTYSMRFYESSSKSGIPSSYYPVADIYDLAGITYDPAAWYEGMSAETYFEDRMYNVPIVAGIPHLVYNKELMREYNKNGAMPNSYDQFAKLLNGAYSKEKENNPAFRAIVMGNSWGNQIITSHASFLQNDAEYYRYENGNYVNKWSEDVGGRNALAAFDNLYSLFGKDGECGGEFLTSGHNDADIVSKVGSGDAFMGVCSFPGQAAKIVRNGKIGVLPLSGLFSNGENKELIPAYTMGLGFYKAKNLTNTELAACAVFADYFTKHSYLLARGGWYPVYKAALTDKGFTETEFQSLKFMADFFEDIGDPENFIAMYGHPNRRTIAESTANDFLVPFLQGNGENSSDLLDALAKSLPGNLAY